MVVPKRVAAEYLGDHRLACVRAGCRSAVWAPQGGDGQMQVPRTQHASGCRECGAGSVLGTPVATTGRATRKENHHMTIRRMDNVLIVVDDLEATKAFFVELGMELEGETTVEGHSVNRLIGL